MGTLRSALEELAAEDLRFAADEVIEDDVVEIERASRGLEAERLRRIAELDARGSFARDGYLSMSAWLVHRLRIAWSTAGQHVRMARGLRRMPRTREALAGGDVSATATAMLVSARETSPAEFVRVEETLLDAACTLGPRQLRAAIGYWRDAVDRAAAIDEAERRRELRRLHVSPALDGMVRVDGDLDPETGQVVITALRAVMAAAGRDGSDARTTPQRRADALGEICHQWMDGSNRPSVAGERPHLTVTVDLETLERRAGRRCAFDDAGRAEPEDVRRIACDASVTRVVTVPPSSPLDVGRRTPVVPAALRRAVVVRDGGCRFPGCDRPPGWCDAHHVVHWADGGETSLDNLVLLCRPHHRLVHERFSLAIEDGRPAFRRPDGTLLRDDPSPLTGRPRTGRHS
jgi:5-methylcytosine-specific restriction endonuclease McrA